ncbi:MAG: GNAT family N-acetyltransferase [Candidatus Heimdallarchaeota archaeon]|nr:MAG: GNAT family N-acetyltransferase [Candidatus Heimdallarchaeota archaeon]
MIKFRKMTEQEFLDYLEYLIKDYSKDYAQIKKVGLEEAKKQTELQIEVLLPKGYATPDVFIGFIRGEAQNIGHIWYIHEHKKKYTFLADIEVFPEFRNEGYATQALKLLEKEVISHRFQAIVLHVFKHNFLAKRLYEKLGYTIIQEVDTGFNMVKRLLL